MELSIVTGQIKDTLLAPSLKVPIYQIWMGNHLEKLKDGR